MGHHAPAKGGVRERPNRGTHVLLDVRRLAGSRDGAGHIRVRDDELEKELGPVDRTNLPGPGGKLVSFDRADQITLAKGTRFKS